MKAPANQWYVKDFLTDVQLGMAHFITKGIWADMLNFMWLAPIKGQLSGTFEGYKRLLGATDSELELFFSEAEALRFCDTVTDANKIITVTNRRMYREEKAKEANRMRQKRYRDKGKDNGTVTPTTASASAFPSTRVSKDTPASAGSSKHFRDKTGSYFPLINQEIIELLKLPHNPAFGRINYYSITQMWTNKTVHPEAIYETWRNYRGAFETIRTSYAGFANALKEKFNAKFNARDCERASSRFKEELNRVSPEVKALLADAFES